LAIVACAAIGGAYVMLGAHEAAEAADSDQQETGERAAASAVEVEALHPIVGGLQRTTTQPGSVIPDKSADLFAKVSGYLQEQSVDIGSRVKEGEVLAVIDMPELHKQVARSKAALDQAKAQVVQAEAHVNTAKAEAKAANEMIKLYKASVDSARSMLNFREKVYDRMYKLAKVEKAIDMKLVDEKEEQKHAAEAALLSAQASVLSAEAQASAAEAKIEQAQADLVNAQANVEVADAQLQKDKVLADYTVIRSPYTGIVTIRHFWPGDFVQARDQGAALPLLTVQKTDLMRVKVQVPDAEVPFTDPGDEAVVSIDALPGKTFRGKVSRISGAEDPETRTMRVEIDLENKDGVLRDGMYGKVTISLEQSSQGLAVPSSCLVAEAESGKASLYVIRDGKARKVAVSVGDDNGVLTEVRSGLRANDVVARPLRGSLADGVEVKVIESSGSARQKAASH
jgi:RND family efflux transporter MFP subunit